ncbi:hypothetical protein [Pseudomonas sp. DWP3-1-2]|uniref:hypothetical protein n=1 Tax=Pseudomonas sp. DWP3-1-2 TaxID=2804645 RepID=UPI003CF475ED
MKAKLLALSKSGRAQVALASVAMLSAGSSFAAGEIDTSEALTYIAGGVVAAGLVTGAMFGLVALIGAAKKAMRAGT